MDRHTTQRRAIEDALRDAARPLSPPELLEAARCSAPSINLATIYRSIKRMIDAGEIRAVALPGEPSRYELAGLAHHHHFKCQSCDRVFDVPGKCPKGLADGLPRGFAVTGHEVVLFGTCSDCPETKPARARSASSSRRSTARLRGN